MYLERDFDHRFTLSPHSPISTQYPVTITMFIQRKASTLSSTSRQLRAKKRFIACRIGAEQYAFPLEFIERILDVILIQ